MIGIVVGTGDLSELALDLGHHSLFFIPVHFFPYLLWIVGVALWIHQVVTP